MAVAIPQTKEEADFYPTSDGKPMAETHLHQQQMMYLIDALTVRYADDPNVYVWGNNFLYYEQGNRKAVVSPDCYVVFGVPKRVRATYKLWEEHGKAPDVVFEITSKKTRREDMQVKFPLYQSILAVSEYFRYDPTGDYLRPRLQGFRLIHGQYEPIPMVNGHLHSAQLALDLVQVGEDLRLYDPQQDILLPTPLEMAEQAQAEAQRANLEAQRADLAEAELVRLRAELDALRNNR